MKTEDFDYELPPELIAQAPAKQREQSRLLQVGQRESQFEDLRFSDFVSLCAPGDLLVVNNTRVVPARLKCQKPSGGQVEVMLERLLSEYEFLALARSNKTLKAGQVLLLNSKPALRFIERQGTFFKFEILEEAQQSGYALFHQNGNMPLPPYIKREVVQQDTGRYQTVYAQADGAVAAPTAGLHFNPAILTQLQEKGIALAELTLHVGAGTFQPVKVDDVTQHKMHSEWIEVSAEVLQAIEHTRTAGGRVIAVGTTTVRALESVAQRNWRDGCDPLQAYQGPTDIFIYPGYQFSMVDALLTNFHLPKSTLLMMISAFAGSARVKAAYAHAIAQHYRFFSYGDAMFIEHQTP